MPWLPLPDPDAPGPAPQRLGRGLDAVMADLGAPPVDVVRTLHRHWADIVGEAAQAEVRLATVDDGVLVVEVDEPAWATKLRFASAGMVRRAGSLVGPDIVRAVEVQVRPRRRRSG